jgi:hypothetical protein
MARLALSGRRRGAPRHWGDGVAAFASFLGGLRWGCNCKQSGTGGEEVPDRPGLRLGIGDVQARFVGCWWWWWWRAFVLRAAVVRSEASAASGRVIKRRAVQCGARGQEAEAEPRLRSLAVSFTARAPLSAQQFADIQPGKM